MVRVELRNSPSDMDLSSATSVIVLTTAAASAAACGDCLSPTRSPMGSSLTCAHNAPTISRCTAHFRRQRFVGYEDTLDDGRIFRVASPLHRPPTGWQFYWANTRKLLVARALGFGFRVSAIEVRLLGSGPKLENSTCTHCCHSSRVTCRKPGFDRRRQADRRFANSSFAVPSTSSAGSIRSDPMCRQTRLASGETHYGAAVHGGSAGVARAVGRSSFQTANDDRQIADDRGVPTLRRARRTAQSRARKRYSVGQPLRNLGVGPFRCPGTRSVRVL